MYLAVCSLSLLSWPSRRPGFSPPQLPTDKQNTSLMAARRLWEVRSLTCSMKKCSLRLYALLTRHILTQDWICEREERKGEGGEEENGEGEGGEEENGEGERGRGGRGREGGKRKEGEIRGGRGGKKRRGLKDRKTTLSNNFCLCFYMKQQNAIRARNPYHAHTYHDNSCCLLPEVLQPLLVGLLLLVTFPVGLKLHSLCFMCTKVFHPLPEGSSHQSSPPVRLQLHNQWFVGFHQCPAVIVSCHLSHHSLRERRGR